MWMNFAGICGKGRPRDNKQLIRFWEWSSSTISTAQCIR